MRASALVTARLILLSQGQQYPRLPEVGLGSLTSGGEFYKDRMLPQVGEGEMYMEFVPEAVPGGQAQPWQQQWEAGGSWQQEAHLPQAGSWQQQPDLGDPWQQQALWPAEGPWHPGYQPPVQAGYPSVGSQPGYPVVQQGRFPAGEQVGWQGQPPCSPEPPVFPAVYSCNDCAWMYEQSLPCWQQYDPCNSYYGCNPVHPVPVPPPTRLPLPTTPATKPSPTPTTHAPAPDNCTGEVEVSVDEHQFLLSVSDQALTWPEADAKAVAHGVNWALATLESRSEALEVFRLLRERGCKLARVWLGGNSLAEADQWVWPDGQQVSEESGGMWGRGEPAPGRGECMMLAETEWEAADCLDDKSVEAFLAHHKPADSTKPHTRPTPKPTKPLSTKRTTIVVPTETTHPGEMQTPS